MKKYAVLIGFFTAIVFAPTGAFAHDGKHKHKDHDDHWSRNCDDRRGYGYSDSPRSCQPRGYYESCQPRYFAPRYFVPDRWDCHERRGWYNR